MTKKLLLQRGFTLVELLIVIALLGALAIGLIGALDPFEQLKKGTDTGTRNTVSEVQGAIVRYFALKGYMPWCASDTSCPSTPASEPLNGATNMTATISKIAASGELKTDFTTIQSNQLGKVFVTGDQLTAKVCYKPTAKSFQSDVNTKFAIDASTGSDCKSTGGATDCYWCVQ